MSNQPTLEKVTDYIRRRGWKITDEASGRDGLVDWIAVDFTAHGKDFRASVNTNGRVSIAHIYVGRQGGQRLTTGQIRNGDPSLIEKAVKREAKPYYYTLRRAQ